MFTDIVGYTALMSKNEQKALAILQKNREILKPLIEQFNGEWFKEIGDGTLSSFPSVVNAVNCAMKIQSLLREDPELCLRIGIHIGDVVFSKGDVFGDGVNVASRLEKLAEPGGICVSGRVYSEIRNKPDIEAVFLGEKQLKNVDFPIKVFALRMEGLPKLTIKTFSVRKPSATESQPSIAVLPFRDMSPQKDQEYFCEGMAENIIDALTQIENLHVAARTSAFAYKDRHEDIREIGRQLNVGTLMEGSIQKSGNRLRITVQVVNVDDGYHIWSEKFDQNMEDIFAIQDEISLAVVDKLKIKLLGGEKAKLVKRHTDDSGAYELYLKGRYFWNMRYEAGMGMKKAIEYFQQAIEKDPLYALPYVGIADTFSILGFYGFLPPNEAFPKAMAALRKALEIDNNLGEAHVSLGWIKANFDWDWLAAESEFKLAIKLNPSIAMAYSWYAVFLMLMGRIDEAIVEAKRAQKMDPLELVISGTVGVILYFARQYDEALEQLRNASEMAPNFLFNHLWLGWVYLEKKMYEDAIVSLQKASNIEGRMTLALGYLGMAYALSGQKKEALKILEELNELSRERYISPFQKAVIYLGLEMRDQVFECLEQALLDRDSFLLYSEISPMFDNVRPDERFKALMNKIGLNRGN